MDDLPDFNADGVLPRGDYRQSLESLAASMLVHGTGGSPTWDAAWRSKLVLNLAVMVSQLRAVGITEVFVDGSFVEDKDHPNDIDGYFVCERGELFSGELESKLNALDPHKCWTWARSSRRPYRGSGKAQLPMWHIYRVELYPHYGQKSGIRDQYGNELEFPAAFRKSRHGDVPKGIIKIVEKTK